MNRRKLIGWILKTLSSFVQAAKANRWQHYRVYPAIRSAKYPYIPGDIVIFASSPIPGNEKSVSRIVDNLYRLGAKVIYGSGSATGMHVSGHGFREELKLMLSLMKPKYFIPIHGEYRMLKLIVKWQSRLAWKAKIFLF